MLKNLQGKETKGVPHADDFERVLKLLRPERADAARAFSSSYLGSSLSPWTNGLRHLYDVACEELGETAEDRDIEARAALIFGLFVWECIALREETWVFDPNLSARDPNRDLFRTHG